MNNIHWDAIKEFYQREFGIEGWLVEMYANLDILSLCVSGACNDSIVKFLELPMAEVIKVLSDTFEFEGWAKDLPINPYKIFCSYGDNKSTVQHFQDFTSTIILELSKYSGFETVKAEKLFYMCETMYDIERKIQDEWI